MLKVEPVKQGSDGVAVVVMVGSADIHSEGALEQALLKVSAAKPKLVVLDLRAIDILSSLAIGVLVGFRSRVIEGGGKVVMAGVPEPIAKTMRFTRVSELFVRYGTVEEARAAAPAVKR